MYRITIPEWTHKQSGEYHPERSYNANLVEVLLANSPVPSNLVFKYYGENAPASVFRPQPHDRLVFQKITNGEPEEGYYVVIPNIPRDYVAWSKLDA